VQRVPRLPSLLVVSEVALALVLLVGAGLMIKTFLHLQGIDLGFNPKNALTVRIDLPRSRYAQPAEERGRVTITPEAGAFYQQVLENVEGVPGVESVGASNFAVLGGVWERQYFRIEGRPPVPYEKQPMAECNYVTPNYFRAMGIPLLRGRDLTTRDAEGRPWVAIINETLARRFFPGEDPIGKRLMVGRWEKVWREIVGVVGDVRQYEFESNPPPQLYASYLQQPRTQWAWQLDFKLGMTLVVRTAGQPTRLAAAVRNAIQEVNKDAPVYNVKTLDDVFFSQVSQRRFNLVLLGIFAAVALILATVGIYGVISYSMAQRTHEIGVRMALGAARRDVLKLVVGQGMLPVLIGVGVGTAGAFALTRFLTSMLYGVRPTDPATFLAVGGLVTGVALLACYLPARRATKVDPMVALRYE
jgi:putative ABC transport system permease protein